MQLWHGDIQGAATNEPIATTGENARRSLKWLEKKYPNAKVSFYFRPC
jgi:hypothetical protein